jgi:hypothetical protein
VATIKKSRRRVAVRAAAAASAPKVARRLLPDDLFEQWVEMLVSFGSSRRDAEVHTLWIHFFGDTDRELRRSALDQADALDRAARDARDHVFHCEARQGLGDVAWPKLHEALRQEAKANVATLKSATGKARYEALLKRIDRALQPPGMDRLLIVANLGALLETAQRLRADIAAWEHPFSPLDDEQWQADALATRKKLWLLAVELQRCAWRIQLTRTISRKRGKPAATETKTLCEHGAALGFTAKMLAEHGIAHRRWDAHNLLQRAGYPSAPEWKNASTSREQAALTRRADDGHRAAVEQLRKRLQQHWPREPR